MNFIKSLKTKSKKLLISSGIAFSLFGTHCPANAFIPYFYEPNQENLEKTSILIGRNAAQLIYFGQEKEATYLAELATRLNPNDDRLWAVLAEAHARNNEVSKAIISIKKAKEIKPNKASIWFAEASLYLQQKDAKKASKQIIHGLTLDPKNATAYFQLGNARIMQSKPRQALKAFIRASQLKKDFWEALNNQALVLFELGKTSKAIKVWQETIKVTNNAEPMLALAAALNQVKPNNEESIELTKKALSGNPNYVSPEYQKDQLWGEKLIAATKELFKNPVLLYDIRRASANSK